MTTVTLTERPCTFRVIRQAIRPSARNPEPGWISQCQHPRCLGHWRTGLATEAHARQAYAKHECDERHILLHPGCFVRVCLEDNSHVRIEGYRGKAPGHEEDEMTDTATTETQTPEVTETEQTPKEKADSRRAGKLTPCFCRTFEAGVDTGDEENPDVTIETTGCDRMTNRTFAQGHDAKLVSFLVAAELDGKDIRHGRDTGMVTTTDAVGAAKMVSHELAAKTAKALENGRGKLQAKEQRAAAKRAKGEERAAALQAKIEAREAAKAEKAAAKEAAEQAAQPATDEQVIRNIPKAKVAGKVGRWEYKGTVNPDGTFTYTAGNGEEKTAPAGQWQPLES